MMTRVRTSAVLALALVVAAALVGCPLTGGGAKKDDPNTTAAPEPEAKPQTPAEKASPAPPPAANEVSLTVWAIGDLHGQLQPVEVDKRQLGGAGWIAGYLSAVRATNPGGVIAVDTGDAFTGPLISSHSEGACVIEFFNTIKLDAMAIGNHEFDFGPVGPLNRSLGPDADPRGALKALAKQAQFPLLTANLYEGEQRFAPAGIVPYTIVEKNGVKVALVGLVTEKLPVVTLPYNLTGMTYRRHGEELAKILPEVREKGATVVILVAHVGADYDTDAKEHLGEVADLANALNPGDVDLIVGGHTKKEFGTVINGIPVVKPPDYGRGFTRVDLFVDKATGKANTSKTKILEPVMFWHDAVGPDGQPAGPAKYAAQTVIPLKAADTALNKYVNAVERLKESAVGEAITDLTRLGTYNSSLGNLVVDAMLLVDDAVQIALFNGGGLRADINVGPITFGDLFDTMPFDNTVVVVDVTGEQLKAALENGLTGNFGTLEFAGGKVYVDPAQPVGSRVIRVLDKKGNAIKPSDTVKVAINDFMLAGGDEYNMFPRSTAIETGADIRELMVKLIDLRGKTVIPDIKPRYKAVRPGEQAPKGDAKAVEKKVEKKAKKKAKKVEKKAKKKAKNIEKTEKK